MHETHYSAAPALARPLSFLRDAGSDLRRAVPIAWRLFGANVKMRYRRAWLGYLWLVLPAAGTAALFAFIRARGILAPAQTQLPYPLFVFAGVTFWQIFLEALNSPLNQLRAMRPMITGAKAPHEAMIGAGLLELLLNTAVRLVLLGLAMAAFGVAPAPTILLVPLGVVALAALGVGIGLLAAPFGMLWDDIGRGMFFVAAVLFFLTPVAYPLPASGLLALNPVSPLLDTTRAWISGPASPWGFLAATGGSLVLLIIALLFYRLARPHFVARLG